MLYTSRFQNPELKSGDYTAVRISLGAPRWSTGYKIDGSIKELMPSGLRDIDDITEFAPLYYEKLDSFGVENIDKQLRYYESFGKPVVLLCFEDVRKGGNNWCHRLVFAKWWKVRTGEDIPELKDDSAFMIEGDPIIVPEVTSGDNKSDVVSEVDSDDDKSNVVSEVNSNDNKPTIVVTYSTWYEDKDGDMYYLINPLTGKQERIADNAARQMLINGEADLQIDYESIPKILFTLKKDSIIEVVKNRKGKKTSISFEEARKLLLEGKANIEDIKIE